MIHVFKSIENDNITIRIKADNEAEALGLLMQTILDANYFELTEIY